MTDQTTPDSNESAEAPVDVSLAASETQPERKAEQESTSDSKQADGSEPVKHANRQMTSKAAGDTHTESSMNTTNIENHSGKSGGKALGLTALLLSLVALGGSGYHYYLSQLSDKNNDGQLLISVNSISSDVKVLAERMNQLQRAQTSLEQGAVSKEQLKTGLLETNSKNDMVLRDIKDEQQSLKETVSKFVANTERGADKLALDEVSQLLKLANNSAVFSGDRLSAINALKLADTQLKQLADPRYSVVRRTINREIGELDAIKSVDVSSVTAEIHALAKRIPSLPLENEPPVVGQVSVAQAEEAGDVTFKSELKKLWVMTLDTVKIKRIDEPPKPLLAPEQRYFLDQNIQLKLNTAELAVMQNNAQVYKRSIESALTWLLDYYDPRDSDVMAVAKQLHELQKQPLGADLPSIAGSYDQLQRLKAGNINGASANASNLQSGN